MEYGWYYENGSIQGTSDDLWGLIEKVIISASSGTRMRSLRVGEMYSLDASDLLDDDDILSACTGVAVQHVLLSITGERYGNLVHGGHAYLANMDEAGIAFNKIDRTQLDRKQIIKDIEQWADKYIKFDPYKYCDGRYPLPIIYHNNHWGFGRKLPHASAIIEYVRDNGKWTCEIATTILEFNSLKQAMESAENRMRTLSNNTSEKELARLQSFLQRTAQGGYITSTASMPPEQIALADAANRLLVTTDGFGFVYVKSDKLL